MKEDQEMSGVGSERPQIVVAIAGTAIEVFSTAAVDVLIVQHGVGCVGDRGVYQIENDKASVTKRTCEPNMDQLPETAHYRFVQRFVRVVGWQSCRFVVFMYPICKSTETTDRVISAMHEQIVVARTKQEAIDLARMLQPDKEVFACLSAEDVGRSAMEAMNTPMNALRDQQQKALSGTEGIKMSFELRRFLHWVRMSGVEPDDSRTLEDAQRMLDSIADDDQLVEIGGPACRRRTLAAELVRNTTQYGRQRRISHCLGLPEKQEGA